MATNTTNYNLVKPAYADTADIADINGNMDIIDGQMKTNADGISSTNSSLAKTEAGLAVIVTGDTCPVSVPAGGYAYIKSNTHGLTEGLYRNKTGSAFPTSGGTANSTVFESVSRGGINALKSDIDTLNSKTKLYFSTLAQFKVYVSSMATYDSVNFCGDTEVAMALSGENTMISGTMSKTTSTTADITWASNAGNSVGSARYNESTDTFAVNNINSDITSLENGHMVCTKILVGTTQSGVRTVFIPNNAKLLIIGQSANLTRCFSILVIAYSTGSVYVQEMSKGSGVSFDTSVSNKLKVTTSTEGDAQYMVFGNTSAVQNVNWTT